ncbi:hypothetical protein FPK08_19800 [Mycobacterium tuberculosis]|nr:hypothetical protein FPK08_19800 [Mycobacterium tuberculosis]
MLSKNWSLRTCRGGSVSFEFVKTACSLVVDYIVCAHLPSCNCAATMRQPPCRRRDPKAVSPTSMPALRLRSV